MSALTKDRNTHERQGADYVHPVAAGAKIYAGSLVALSASGFAQPGATAVGLTVVGRADEQVDNSAGADGELSVPVRRGVFLFANDGTDTVTRTHIGGLCYIVDDQTVAATDGTGTRSAAGRIRDVDASGVWVRIY